MIIRIQSIVDVITNSSTEIYVVATDYTLDRIKDIVNAVLEIGESDLTADDLFTFELEDEPDDEDGSYSGYYNCGYKITPKKEQYEKAAKLLSGLENIFQMDTCYNG